MAENNKNKNKVQIDPTYAHLQPGCECGAGGTGCLDDRF